MKKMENLLFRDWGDFVKTCNNEQYEISKVIIFKDNQEKMIANYFINNFKNNEFKFYGDLKRKLKVDLSSNINFVVKSEKQAIWNDKTQYTLYINGDLNNYSFIDLALNGEELDAKYSINDAICTQCIGWNQKESNEIKYNKFGNIIQKIDSYQLEYNPDETLKNIKELEKLTKQYIKIKEEEKTYTTRDYKKMQLASGTAKKENLTILKNNGFDISGLESEDQE